MNQCGSYHFCLYTSDMIFFCFCSRFCFLIAGSLPFHMVGSIHDVIIFFLLGASCMHVIHVPLHCFDVNIQAYTTTVRHFQSLMLVF